MSDFDAVCRGEASRGEEHWVSATGRSHAWADALERVTASTVLAYRQAQRALAQSKGYAHRADVDDCPAVAGAGCRYSRSRSGPTEAWSPATCIRCGRSPGEPADEESGGVLDLCEIDPDCERPEGHAGTCDEIRPEHLP